MLRSLLCAAAAALPVFRLQAQAAPARSTAAASAPNDTRRIPILEYHQIEARDSRWGRSPESFRQDLEQLYARGYRPITVDQLVHRKYEMAPGTRPVVVTFDDASPGQFRYVARGDSLVVDPNSAVGVWLDMHRRHPDWQNRATFCLLSGAKAGHAFFGDKGIDGQLTEWRFRKLRQLNELGFELCAHTLWHANLAKYSDAVVQEQIARSVLAIDSAVAGYKVRTFALPLGVWPRNRELALRGSWRDAKSGHTVPYEFDAVLEVAGNPVLPPTDPAFDPHRLQRIQVLGNQLAHVLDRLDDKVETRVAASPRRSSVVHVKGSHVARRTGRS